MLFARGQVLCGHLRRNLVQLCSIVPDTFGGGGTARQIQRLHLQNHFQIRHQSFLAHCDSFPKLTHNCGDLRASDDGSQVVLGGWLLSERKGREVSFFPLKDSYGTTQLTVDRGNEQLLQKFSRLPPESVVVIEGTVSTRPEQARRPVSAEISKILSMLTNAANAPKIPTGDIDVKVTELISLNPVQTTLPFSPSNPHNLPNDDLRSKFRYLDLRRSTLSENIIKRSQVSRIIRNVFNEYAFVDVETPVLIRSSPEGAREYLVPSRTSSSSTEEGTPLFYALSQSPQQAKQLLICSGAVERYFQFAKCFRDEDGRKDRQPEFTQVDLEMAFVSWGNTRAFFGGHDLWRIGGLEIRELIEKMMYSVWLEVEGVSLPKQFKVLTYQETMKRYGTDKPDLRFELEIKQLNEILHASLRSVMVRDCKVMDCLVVREQDKQFISSSRSLTLDSPATHFSLSSDNFANWLGESSGPVNEALKLVPGDDVWICNRSINPRGGSTELGEVRLQIAEAANALGKYQPSEKPHFLWVTEFPLFTHFDEDKDHLAHGRWSSTHHPFTAPMAGDIDALVNGDIESVRGQHYDLVLNGVEVGGGSVRVHDPAMQEYIFRNVLQLTEEEQEPFQPLLHALKCGAPPHGGIAIGFDRLMSILCKTRSIRDVIAFPKTTTGTDLLFKSPAPVSNLSQYGLQPSQK